jgi:hypothetical protein
MDEWDSPLLRIPAAVDIGYREFLEEVIIHWIQPCETNSSNANVLLCSAKNALETCGKRQQMMIWTTLRIFG